VDRPESSEGSRLGRSNPAEQAKGPDVPARLRPQLVRAVDWASRYAVYAFIAVVLLVAAVLARSMFSSGNLSTMAIQAATLGVVTLGQMLVLLVRGIDLSVGAVMAIGAILVVETQGGRSIGLAFLLALALALAIGLVNGLLVAKRNVPPFVATLGMLILVEGARLAYTKGQASGLVPDLLGVFNTLRIGFLPLGTLGWIVLAVGVALVLRRTPLGRMIYATGSNPQAARLSGVRTDRIVMAMFVASSVLALFAGLLLSGYIGYVDQHLAAGYNLNSITAAVIGGTSFAGGRGTVAGTMAGVILVTILVSLVVAAGLPVELQFILQGIVLIAAVALQGLQSRIAEPTA
jgi:ribose/xylose/arabinose/galactoside ABC-type transport system permease subunit